MSLGFVTIGSKVESVYKIDLYLILSIYEVVQMPANLTPQYLEVEQKYRAAKALPEKIAALQEMLKVIPKHKGTDHLRADMRSRLSRHLEQLEKPSATRSGGPQPFNIRKEGAGQVVVIGLPTSGKSEVLNALTKATAIVGDYPFTTKVPNVGMMSFENINIQLIDTPALTYKIIQTQLFGLLRNADLFLIALDLSADPINEMATIEQILSGWGIGLLDYGNPSFDSDEGVYKAILVIANKCDMDFRRKNWLAVKEHYGNRFNIVRFSCLDGTGFQRTKKQTFSGLNKVRIYTKSPGGTPQYDNPMVINCGSTISDVAYRLHKEWKGKLKYALLWGSSRFDGQRVGKEYLLSDGDTVELHG
ncbi:TGS domain-containing protein [SAR202 cluster bacterium AC-409-J13_OGT_754m]|nr:TGS domain-containing protein [SAR202 cluster bacterium AC-409-J13_OGT_754m]